MRAKTDLPSTENHDSATLLALRLRADEAVRQTTPAVTAKVVTGGAGNNVLNGTSGDDTITDPGGTNTLNGFEGNDKLTGGKDTDTLNGGDGNDLLNGGKGNDALHGDADNDILVGGDGNDLFDGGDGIDTADFSAATVAVTVNLTGFGGQPTGQGSDTFVDIENITGGSKNDSLTGDAGDNVLNGGLGDDALQGGAGFNILIGGRGADYLDGTLGYDIADYSTATAKVSLNFLTGVHGGDAAGDLFFLIEEYDLSNYADTFVGAGDAVTVHGGQQNDTITGGSAADLLFGDDGNDTLNGGLGNDTLVGGEGADKFNGGGGIDTVDYSYTNAITLNLTTGVNSGQALGDTFAQVEQFLLTFGVDSFTGSAAAETVFGGDSDDVLSGAAGADTLHGQAGADTLNGGNDADALFGEDGADILNGDAGDDSLNGGLGDDFMVGGAGADAFDGDQGIDTASYASSTGGVIVDRAFGGSTGDAVGDTFVNTEIFTLSGFGDGFIGTAEDETVNGGGGTDTLQGRNGVDHLDGGDGDDFLIGGNGNDTLTGGNGADQFWANAGLFGADTVTDFQNGIDHIRLSTISGVDDFTDLTISTNGSGWAVVTLPDGSSLTLTGVLASAIDASDFLFI